MELIFAFLVWLGHMPTPPPSPPRVALAEPARVTSPLPPPTLGGSPGGFAGEDEGDESTGAAPPDPPVPIVAFSDDRVDADENGHPWHDKDWEGFLHFRLGDARAAFDGMTRPPLSPAQAKWRYRAWGQP
jgi:hypothetical protein